MRWYNELQQLHSKLHQRGLEILAFPCNQFMSQEPQNADKIETCVRAKYSIGFTLLEKINVNGTDTHPVFRWLRLRSSPDASAIMWKYASCQTARPLPDIRITHAARSTSPPLLLMHVPVAHACPAASTCSSSTARAAHAYATPTAACPARLQAISRPSLMHLWMGHPLSCRRPRRRTARMSVMRSSHCHLSPPEPPDAAGNFRSRACSS